MKYLFFLIGLILATYAPAQSLLDADSIIVIQESDTTFTLLAVTVYPGIKADALKQVYRDRYEKSQRLKLQSARQYLQLEEKAKVDEAKFIEIIGDTIAIDSITLDGEWDIKGGETSIIFTITDNQSGNNKVKLKILSAEEMVISLDKVGEIPFYKQDENNWVGKADTLYKMTRRKAKEKARK